MNKTDIPQSLACSYEISQYNPVSHECVHILNVFEKSFEISLEVKMSDIKIVLYDIHIYDQFVNITHNFQSI